MHYLGHIQDLTRDGNFLHIFQLGYWYYDSKLLNPHNTAHDWLIW